VRAACTDGAVVVALIASIAALLATAYLIAVHLPALGGEPWLSEAKGAQAAAP
jgi:hypothetical protein